MDFEKEIRNKLLMCGFPNEKLLNNRGLIGATIDEVILMTVKNLAIHNVSSSAWEQKLVGKNIHSVFTWCKDCGMRGCNIPFENECGNCGSKNTVRYYDKETIDLLF